MALTGPQSMQAIRDLVRTSTEPVAFTRADLQAAITAVDAWATANAAAYNTALPTNFRTAATAAQKNLLLAYVCLRRAGL